MNIEHRILPYCYVKGERKHWSTNTRGTRALAACCLLLPPTSKIQRKFKIEGRRSKVQGRTYKDTCESCIDPLPACDTIPPCITTGAVCWSYV